MGIATLILTQAGGGPYIGPTCVPFQLTVTDTSWPLKSLIIDWGDGGPSTALDTNILVDGGNYLSHLYKSPGNYLAKLTLTDQDGSWTVNAGVILNAPATTYVVHQFYFSNSWSDQNLTGYANGAFAASWSGISSFAISDGQHVFYVASDQHVHQLYYNNSSWSDQDLTSANGALAAAGSEISSFATSDGQHVFYVASDQHIHPLYYNNSSWIDQDLTSANGALAVPGSGISSFAISDGQHVFYITSDQHIHQLYYNNSSWIDQDLTDYASGGVAAYWAGGGISSFAISDGQHVFYVASNLHVHQLYYNNSSWIDQDLTDYASGGVAAPGNSMSSFAISDGQHVYLLELTPA